MHISKARERIVLPIHSQTSKFKTISIFYLLSKAKHKLSLKELKEKRKWKSKTKKLMNSKTTLKETFNIYDKDKNGYVNPADLGNMIRTLGGNPTGAQINEILAKEKLNGPFGYDRFVRLLRKYLRARPKSHELRKAFEVMDNDDDGYVNVENVKHILTTMGESLDPQEFDEWIQSLGVENNGKVTFDEIIAPMVDPQT